MKAILVIISSLGISTVAAAQSSDSGSLDAAPTAAPLGSQASAQAPSAQTLPSSTNEASVSLTMSPLHLVLPIIEVTGEYRVNPKLGVAVILGGGKVTPKNSPSSSVYEVGASVRYYALGSFRKGIQIGAEVDYLHVSADGTDVKGAGIAAGPFVGAKWVSSFGLTLDGQIGGQYLKAQASSSTTTASASNAAFLLNLNIGYSF
jgi:hypothetical protein